MNTVASKTWRTFNEWSATGYKINKGSKASWHDGIAKFSQDQVTYSPPYSWSRAYTGSEYDEYMMEHFCEADFGVGPYK